MFAQALRGPGANVRDAAGVRCPAWRFVRGSSNHHSVQRVAKVNRSVALDALEAAGMKVSVALVMLRTQVAKPEAIRRLKRAQGSIRKATES